MNVKDQTTLRKNVLAIINFGQPSGRVASANRPTRFFWTDFGSGQTGDTLRRRFLAQAAYHLWVAGNNRLNAESTRNLPIKKMPSAPAGNSRGVVLLHLVARVRRG